MAHSLSPYLLWRTLFYLIFMPSIFLALTLDTPAQSGIDVFSITITWTGQAGDPEILLIGLVEGPACPLFLQDGPVFPKLAYQGVTFPASVNSTRIPDGPGSCVFQVADGTENSTAPLLPSDIIAQSPHFHVRQFPTIFSSLTNDKGGVKNKTATTQISGPAGTDTTMITPTNHPLKTNGTNPGPKNEAPSRGAIIGGVVGGLTFVILFSISLFLCMWKKKKNSDLNKNIYSGTSILRQNDEERQAPTAPESSVLRFFHWSCQPRYTSTPHPMLYSGVYHQQEGKRERFERIQREMEETRRQREALQSDLERRRGGTGESGNGLDDEVNRLKNQIEELTRRMGEFEIIRQDDLEMHAPPDYYHPSV
ncbi:hypothetical protein BDZ94DRAFT_1311846 [Collybia nuda]|uniref:Uncharacterized protein n=1 Tax=Collybia nuda TaxID=64659 RepID=A0A9P5Y295_9AGAR|nr:hypothetical protein BDZ94DRAFT_1311846 [Collybia nuda]